MQLLQALRAAPRAIQRRGDTIYAVAHRPPTPGSAACYTVKRYPATQCTGPIVRALSDLEPLAAFLHRQLALDPDAWEPASAQLSRTDAPTLRRLLQFAASGPDERQP